MLTTPLQTGSTVLSGQWDTHNRSVYSPPSSNVQATVFLRICFPEAARNDLPPAELWCACSFADRRYICLSAGVVLLNTISPRAVYYTFQ
ncbi:hypothetical protein TNCV_2421331 [Trichonephila clavipes]|nr:hypothetical protein TNCV_2421331 [Trichonephila clavipes]